MRCYDCAVEDRVEEAVGICVVCGRGVCLRHARLQHLPQFYLSGAGIGGPVRRRAQDRARVVCTECEAAVGQRELSEVHC